MLILKLTLIEFSYMSEMECGYLLGKVKTRQIAGQ